MHLRKGFRFESREVEIFRRGNAVLLPEKRRNLANAFDRLEGLSYDLIEAIEHMDDLPPEERGVSAPFFLFGLKREMSRTSE